MRNLKTWFIGLLFSFFYSNVSLADVNYPDFQDSSDFVDDFIETDPSYPGDGRDRFRCEIVIIVVDLDKKFERKRHSVFASGRSWSDSRGRAFAEYGRWIGQNRASVEYPSSLDGSKMKVLNNDHEGRQFKAAAENMRFGQRL